MALKADNTEFAIEIVDEFIKILKKHVHEDKTVKRGIVIDEHAIGQGKGIEKFKSEMLKIFIDNTPEPKDDYIFNLEDVLRYYETINLDIEGSKEILKTFDSVDRVFEVPSPLPEEIAAATAENEAVSKVVPSGSAGKSVKLDDKIAEEVGQDEQGPVPSPAPMPPQGGLSGGGKKKRTHNKKKRRSKKKSTPVKEEIKSKEILSNGYLSYLS